MNYLAEQAARIMTPDQEWDALTTREPFSPAECGLGLLNSLKMASDPQGTTRISIGLAKKRAASLTDEKKLLVVKELLGDVRSTVTDRACEGYVGGLKSGVKQRIFTLILLCDPEDLRNAHPTPYDKWIQNYWYAAQDPDRTFERTIDKSAYIELGTFLLAESVSNHVPRRRAELGGALERLGQRVSGGITTAIRNLGVTDHEKAKLWANFVVLATKKTTPPGLDITFAYAALAWRPAILQALEGLREKLRNDESART